MDVKKEILDYASQVLKEEAPDAIRALLVSAVTIGVFLPLSIRVFDKKDVK